MSGFLMGLAIVVAAAVLALAKNRATAPTEPADEKAAARPADCFTTRQVLEKTELQLLTRLAEALPNRIILAQMAYSAFLKLKPGTKNRRLLNHIDRKRIDFLILESSGAIAAAIELDGAAHDNDEAAAEDQYKTAVMKAAGVKLIRWRADQLPKGPEIRAAIETQPEATGAPRSPGV